MSFVTVWGWSAVLHALTAVQPVDAQHNVIVEESDPSLAYSPLISVWDLDRNPQTRWDGRVDPNYFHGGSYVAIYLPGASVSFTFNGSYIAYYSDQNASHGSMTVTLDGKATTLNTYNAAGPVPQVKIFESTLDPDIPNHTITLTCLELKGMGLDYFLYTAATPAISLSKTESSITPPTSSSISSPFQGPVSTGPVTIVTAVLAAIGSIVAFVFAFLFFRQRRQRGTRTVYLPSHHSVHTAPSAQGVVSARDSRISAGAPSARTSWIQSPPAYSQDQ